MKYFSVLILSVFILSACGSNGDEGSNIDDEGINIDKDSPWPPPSVNSDPDSFGNILDSAVEGLRYISGDHYGTTDSDGKFGYIAGEKIQFLIGDILIGEAVLPSSRLTPYELANGNSSVALNISRFLQTLDNDSDPNNGIQINETVHYLSTSKALNFSGAGWEDQPATNIDNIVFDLTSGTEAGSRHLVQKYNAYTHFSYTLDNLIDNLSAVIDDMGKQSTCDTDNQCVADELLTKYTHYCPPSGPLIVYSQKDIDHSAFDSLVSEREYLIDAKRYIESAAGASDTSTGVCMRLPQTYRPVCNVSNHCEILD